MKRQQRDIFGYFTEHFMLRLAIMEFSTTQKSPKTAPGQPSTDGDLRALGKVREIFAALSKYINAKTIYSSNNPNTRKFAETFHRTIREYFEVEKELLLTVEQYQLKWRGEIVYDNQQKNESIAFLLYKDGVGEITILSSVTTKELELFTDLVNKETHNPSMQLDIVNRLWEADFKDIFYRVYDECADGTSGDTQGAGSSCKEHPLRVNDHPDLSTIEDDNAFYADSSSNFSKSIEAYFSSVVERKRPGLPAYQKELYIQKMLQSSFAVDLEELSSWRDDFTASNDKDKLLWLLGIMFDFTQTHSTPPVVRDVLDMTDRLTRNIIQEANISSLIALMNMQKRLALSPGTSYEYRSLHERIGSELTNGFFLQSLGKTAGRPQDDVHELLKFYQLVGKNSVPGICELLKNLNDPVLQKKACDVLLDIAEEDITHVLNTFDLDDSQQAANAVYLLLKSQTAEVSPLIKNLMSSPHAHVRALLVQYLICVGNDEAASLLSRLLEDQDAGVRMKACAASEEFKHPLIVDKVTTLCFGVDDAARSSDELERLFRAVGKLAGANALGPIKQMIGKKHWLPVGASRSKREKLLAITALRYMPGQESLELLKKLSADRDNLVKTKALYVLRRSGGSEEGDEGDPASIVSEEAE